jgi:hypothetical protein
VSGKEVLRHMADETGSLIEEKPVGVALTTDIHSRFVVAGDIKTFSRQGAASRLSCCIRENSAAVLT